MTDSPQKVTVSHSEVESYLRCERAHFYGYGLEIQRMKTSEALYRGTEGHKALEIFYTLLQGNQSFEQAKIATITYVTSISDAKVMSEILLALNSFFDTYPFKNFTVLAVEKEFILPVTDDLSMPFVVDLLLQDPTGDIWLIDNKFVYNFYTDRDIELLPQLPKYIVGLRSAGVPVDKMAYAMYRYRAQKDQSPDKYFMIKPVIFNPDRVNRTFTEQILVADRIQRIKQQTLEEWSNSAMRTFNTKVCGSCSFRELCVAELNNDQPNLILNSDYQRKQRREFKVTEDD